MSLLKGETRGVRDPASEVTSRKGWQWDRLGALALSFDRKEEVLS